MKFEGTKDLPSLEFDELTGHLRIWGSSTSIEPNDFWAPLYKKMKTYLKEPRDISLEIELEYFNTPSAKKILDLLYLIEKHTLELKRKFVITWIDNDDEDMRNAGQDYSEMLHKNTTWRFKHDNN